MKEDDVKGFLKNTYVKVEPMKLNDLLSQIKGYIDLLEDRQLTELQRGKKQVLQKKIETIFEFELLQEKYNNYLIEYLMIMEEDRQEEKNQAYSRYEVAQHEMINYQKNHDLMLLL